MAAKTKAQLLRQMQQIQKENALMKEYIRDMEELCNKNDEERETYCLQHGIGTEYFYMSAYTRAEGYTRSVIREVDME